MADGPFSKLPFSWEQIFGLIGVLGIVFSFKTPLTTSRPSVPDHRAHPLSGELTVDARLWQDPFDALRLHQQSIDEAPRQPARPAPPAVAGAESHHRDVDATQPETAELALQKRFKTFSQTTPTPIIVLPVFLPGNPYAEEAEQRLRIRYAVLSALSHDYMPQDTRHIGCIGWNRSTVLETPDTVDTAVSVPYEWWIPRKPTAGVWALDTRILVLWINDQDFFTNPLHQVLKLVRAIAKESLFSCRILGPTSSDQLGRFAENLCPADRATKFKIYSPWATADAEREAFRTAHPQVPMEWNIAPDSFTVNALVKELSFRDPYYGFDPRSMLAHIAIVTESDTTYAKSLQSCFDKIAPGAMFRYTYFRGIDGMVATPSRSRVISPTDPTKVATETKEAYASEAPNGQPQFDYLRRITDQLQHKENEIRVRNRTGFFAIGVLGSDVYDKLSVLQALKAQFPEALFFTTDLDARYSSDAEMQWTKNLVIASAYDLKNNELLQDTTPPFRDCYQTATFYATLRAIGGPRSPAIHTPSFAAVHLYETSLNGPVALNSAKDAFDDHLTPRWQAESLFDRFPVRHLFIFSIAVIIVFILFKTPREILFAMFSCFSA